MADDMCGPSNALQNFQKQSTVDRTLQQDRLIHRGSPSQGFRSSPGPNAGLVNQEFEAFQAGHLPPEAQAFNPQPFSHAHPPPQLQQPGPSAGWASDFQRMAISSPSPQMHQPFTPQRQEAGGWHQEFARQQNQMPNENMQIPSHQSSPFRYTPMGGMGMNYNAQSFTPQSQSSIAQQKQPEAFDDEAFARAFEEAARNEEMLAQERQDSEMRQNTEAEQHVEVGQDQGVELGQDILINESASRLLSSDSENLAQQVRIGADQIHDPASPQKDQRRDESDQDALARTAGQLLTSVRNDRSEKFQNSQFLELMRRVRDREVMVAGDKFVGTGDREGDAERAVEEELTTLSQRLLDAQDLLPTLLRLNKLLSARVYTEPLTLWPIIDSTNLSNNLTELLGKGKVSTGLHHLLTGIICKAFPLSSRVTFTKDGSPKDPADVAEALTKTLESREHMRRKAYIPRYIYGLERKDDAAMEQFFGPEFMGSRELRGLVLGQAMLEVQGVLESKGLLGDRNRSQEWRKSVEMLVKVWEEHGNESAEFVEAMGKIETLARERRARIEESARKKVEIDAKIDAKKREIEETRRELGAKRSQLAAELEAELEAELGRR